jgi:transposase
MNYRSFIGIDVSKLTFDVYVYHNKLKQQFTNNYTGYQSLCKWLKENLKHDLKEAFICFEHTGLYSMNLAVFLQKSAVPYAIVPALEIKRSLGVTRGKSDQVDAQRIGEYAYMKREKLEPTVLPSSTIFKLKPLLALRDKLVVDRAGYQASYKEQKRVFNTKEYALLFATYQQLIKELTKKIAMIESEMNDLLQTDEEMKQTFQLIIGIKGIGPLTAAYLIVSTHNFSRFTSWRQFACYAGTAPFEYQSGTSIRGRSKVSPLANKQIKKLLFLSANNAVRYDNELKEYYQRRLKEGKSKMSTLNIIKNKLIARTFAVVKRQTGYVDIRKFAA